MIGRISGKLLEKQPPQLLLDVSGVAYEIEASMHTFYQLPAIQESVIIYTHLVVREDAHLLYGFFDREERSLFRALIKINGVGPKLALAILSAVTPSEFIRCIQQSDLIRLTRIPGVGKKTAERLIVEARDRVDDLSTQFAANFAENPQTSTANFDEKVTTNEAISALVALGYKANEAQRAIQKIFVQGISSEEMIRKALQNMMRG